ncbi:hypothetical protein [Curtobacterium sp. BRD11]|uniref:hypothetical protein n=1 Tax=Curtobacterium sp. BRD11 TaxID=2962581 RepID=UPI0028820BD9|nr:hypothetical protein [Curtobacterium sp. BRD11]MDT0209021.1 hypothetical protein [Curtobacterium sp. BRD11]
MNDAPHDGTDTPEPAQPRRTAPQVVVVPKGGGMSEVQRARLMGAIVGTGVMDRIARDFALDATPVLNAIQASFAPSVERIQQILESSSFTDFRDQQRRLLESMNWTAVGAISDQLSEMSRRIARFLPTADELRRRTLPANLRPTSIPYDPDMFALWMEEGIAVAYVLDEVTIQGLVRASSPQERRAVLSRRRGAILDTCEQLLADVRASSVQRYVETARMALAGVRDGHHQMAQTWAAANLETLAKEHHGDIWPQLVDRNQPAPKLFRAFFFVGQLRTVMANIKDGPVPLSFNRHGSVHFTTTRRHFSKLNATLAIAHFVSAISNFDAAARQATARRA